MAVAQVARRLPTSEPVTGPEARQVRLDTGLSQSQYARALGVGKTTVGRWERGERAIESPRLWRWALFGLQYALDNGVTYADLEALNAEAGDEADDEE